jgi:SAM-dependent methyltransferase
MRMQEKARLVKMPRTPEVVRRWAGGARILLLDALDLLTGRREEMIPPRRLMFDGPRDPKIFRANGMEFLHYYLELCQLTADERVLDLGSGIGRKTIPLTNYLSPKGSYLGLDVNPRGVAWCRSKISTRYPNFRFEHVDVHNARYNPSGALADADYELPFADQSFDFVVLASVFTHMLPAGVEQYMGEVSRVLANGTGRCLITYFLLTEEALRQIENGVSSYRFPHRSQDHAVEHKRHPEDAVAYQESYVRELYEAVGLTIDTIYPGAWCGHREAVSIQDMILARKPPSTDNGDRRD